MAQIRMWRRRTFWRWQDERQKRRGGARILLSASIIAEDASVGDPVGTFSVSGGSGSYTFTLTDDAGGLFAIDGDDLEVAGALDYETAASHSITVEADNGVDDPISRTFSITVTDVSESSFTPSLDFSDERNSQYIGQVV
jgi:hypothetical protein